jgi:hypothetical protein
VSVLATPESHVDHRRRNRSSNCAHATQEASRVNGLPAGDRLTLGQLLDSVWEGLFAGGMAECPLCRGRMVGAATACEAARCERCGTTIA